MDKHIQFPSGKIYCTIHKVEFFGACPKCNTHPMIADGTNKKHLVKSQFEQGIEQGVTFSNKDVPRVDGVDVVSASVRSHAFRFVVSLKDPKNWHDRRKILESKGFKVDPKAGIGRIFMTVFSGFKVWLADKSITIYFPSWKQYFVDEARFGFNFALADLRDLLNDLAVACDSDFLIDKAYHFKCSGQHHALIHNSLARMYNRNKEKLQVFDKKGELWLLIDDSHPDGLRLNETEGVHKDTAPHDVDDIVKPFFNQLRETELLPRDILGMFEKIAKIQEDSVREASNVRTDVDKRLAWMDANFASHQRVLEKIEAKIDKIPSPGSSVKVTTSPLPSRRARRINKYLQKYGWR